VPGEASFAGQGMEESKMRRLTLAVATAVVALCAGLSTASVASAQAPAATIDAVDSPAQAFSPSDVTVAAGQTVRWEFDQAATTHTVTATSSNWTVDETRSPNGAAVEHTFTDPGTYTFHCKIHPNMTGSVTVSAAADALENVLVFSKTAGFRHDSIPAGIAAIQQLGQQNDFNVTATEDAAQFTDANLANFDVIVFLSTTGDVLDDAQQGAFERYIRAGGGFVGIHAAADTEYGWDFYNNMIGASFRNHPAGTPTASVDITDTDEPSTQGLPARWTRTDEWYNYQGPVAPAVNGSSTAADYSPRLSKVHVLATVDLRRGRRQHGRRRPPDLLVLGLRGRPHLVHGHGPHPGLVLGAGLPQAHPRRPGDRLARQGRGLRSRRARVTARGG
jgi:plastocyanin/type 1 glutamine amidotransferase